jgi:hypothetical protein
MSDLSERLIERAKVAREENTGTALGDAVHFEEAAAEIASLRAQLARSFLALDLARDSICTGCDTIAVIAAIDAALTDEKGKS